MGSIDGSISCAPHFPGASSFGPLQFSLQDMASHRSLLAPSCVLPRLTTRSLSLGRRFVSCNCRTPLCIPETFLEISSHRSHHPASSCARRLHISSPVYDRLTFATVLSLFHSLRIAFLGVIIFFTFYPLWSFIKGYLAVIEGHDQRLLYFISLYYNSPFLSHFFSLVSYTIATCDLFFCPYSAQQSRYAHLINRWSSLVHTGAPSADTCYWSVSL